MEGLNLINKSCYTFDISTHKCRSKTYLIFHVNENVSLVPNNQLEKQNYCTKPKCTQGRCKTVSRPRRDRLFCAPVQLKYDTLEMFL